MHLIVYWIQQVSLQELLWQEVLNSWRGGGLERVNQCEIFGTSFREVTSFRIRGQVQKSAHTKQDMSANCKPATVHYNTSYLCEWHFLFFPARALWIDETAKEQGILSHLLILATPTNVRLKNKWSVRLQTKWSVRLQIKWSVRLQNKWISQQIRVKTGGALNWALLNSISRTVFHGEQQHRSCWGGIDQLTSVESLQPLSRGPQFKSW
jgi:hypothetical protein